MTFSMQILNYFPISFQYIGICMSQPDCGFEHAVRAGSNVIVRALGGPSYLPPAVSETFRGTRTCTCSISREQNNQRGIQLKE